MQNTFLIISTIFAFVTPIIGIYGILFGSFRPQRMTRFLFLCISFLFVGTLFAQDDRNSIYLAGIQLLSSLVLFFLSLIKGVGGTDKLDFIVLFLTIISLVIWQTTNNPFLGLIMSLVTDFCAFSPTLLKMINEPETEDWRFYMSDVMASFMSLLSITILLPEILIFPIYILIMNLTGVLLVNKKTRSLINLLISKLSK